MTLMKNTKSQKIKVVLLLIVGLIILLIITFLLFKNKLADIFLNDNEKFVKDCVFIIEDDTNRSISIKDIALYRFDYEDTAEYEENDKIANRQIKLFLETDDELYAQFGREISLSESLDLESYCRDYINYIYLGDTDTLKDYNILDKSDKSDLHYIESDNSNQYNQTAIKTITQHGYEEITDFSLWKIKLFS
jgi:hypothetical protein